MEKSGKKKVGWGEYKKLIIIITTNKNVGNKIESKMQEEIIIEMENIERERRFAEKKEVKREERNKKERKKGKKEKMERRKKRRGRKKGVGERNLEP